MAHIVNGRVGVLAASLALAALLPNLSLAQVAREAAETRESAQALHQKAWDAYQRQQFPEALRLIERVLLIEPEHADYWRFKLYALGNLERNDEVVEAATRQCGVGALAEHLQVLLVQGGEAGCVHAGGSSGGNRILPECDAAPKSQWSRISNPRHPPRRAGGVRLPPTRR